MIYNLVFKFNQNNQDTEFSSVLSLQGARHSTYSSFHQKSTKRAPSASEGVLNDHTAAEQTSTLCYLKQKKRRQTHSLLYWTQTEPKVKRNKRIVLSDPVRDLQPAGSKCPEERGGQRTRQEERRMRNQAGMRQYGKQSPLSMNTHTHTHTHTQWKHRTARLLRPRARKWETEL